MSGWLMALLMLGVVPILLFAMYFNMVTIQQKDRKFQ
jgi:hypothetical protein